MSYQQKVTDERTSLGLAVLVQFGLESKNFSSVIFEYGQSGISPELCSSIMLACKHQPTT